MRRGPAAAAALATLLLLVAWQLLADGPDAPPSDAAPALPSATASAPDGGSMRLDAPAPRAARPLVGPQPIDGAEQAPASRPDLVTELAQRERRAPPRPQRDLELRVVDRDGVPVAGALVRHRSADGETGANALGPERFPGDERVETDERGVARFVLPSDWDEWALVVASGLRARWVELPGGATGPFEVVLEPAGELLVRVALRDGARVDEVRVLVSAPDAVIVPLPRVGVPTMPRLEELVAGDVGARVPWRVSDEVGGGTAWFTPRADGTLLVHDVVDAPLRIELRDRWGELADVVEGVVVRAGERVEVDLVGRTLAPRDLSVAVRAPDGRPAAGARVWLSTSGARAFGGRAEADGVHVFRGLSAERVALGVEHPGCLPYHAEVDVAGGPVFVQLLRAGHVEVQLVDVHGGEVPAESLSAAWTAGGVRVTDRPSASSCSAEGYACTFERLPDGEVELAARVAGRTFTRVHDTRLGPLRWELPCHGTLAVELPRAFDGERLLRVELDELDPSGTLVSHGVRELRAPSGARLVTLPAVLAGRYRVRVLGFDGQRSGFAPLTAWAPLDVLAHQPNVARPGDVR